MNLGDKVRIIKEFDYGIITFEVGDILTVGNYIHKQAVYLKADGVADLIKIKFEDINEYIQEDKVFYPPFVELVGECQNRDWNISLTYQKMTDWSVEIYTGYKSSYEEKYYTDGHTTKETAIQEALEFFEKFNKIGNEVKSNLCQKR